MQQYINETYVNIFLPVLSPSSSISYPYFPARTNLASRLEKHGALAQQTAAFLKARVSKQLPVKQALDAELAQYGKS
jgi:hypothetical protein